MSLLFIAIISLVARAQKILGISLAMWPVLC